MTLNSRQRMVADLFWAEHGDVFDTPFELACIKLGPIDECGNFEARDSEGVVCLFSVDMVMGLAGLIEGTR